MKIFARHFYELLA